MNNFRRHRVVMTTIGSLGDLHPYIALALEMKRRYIEPVIATTENYRERIESARLYKKAIETLTDPWLVELYELREDLGLPPAEHPLFEGQFSPELNLALFANTLCVPKSDWPQNTVITGFPFFDQKDNASMDPELERFLDAGPPPIVFTLGSAAVHVAGDFYRESVKAAKMLQRRAVLLVGSDENRPKERLPEGIAAFNYAPFGELLPRAKALVHQGGVGTTGQGLRAGIPMLVVPFAHDQPDNAARVTRLGVARTITRSNYKAERVARELKELLLNPSYVRRAYQVGHQVRCENGASLAVNHILNQLNERMMNRPALRTVA